MARGTSGRFDEVFMHCHGLFTTFSHVTSYGVSRAQGGVPMGSSWLLVLIVATVGSIGLVEFIVWAVLVIRDPSFDFLKLERRQHKQI